MYINKINLRSVQYQCIDCGETFEFSSDDQLQYLSRGFYPPKRCKKCRQHNREVNDNTFYVDKTLRCKTSSFFEDAQIYGPRENVKTGLNPRASFEWNK